MSESDSTHIVFDGQNLVISPDLAIIFDFLMEIEKEVGSFLGFFKKIESIRKQYSNLLEFILFLSGKLKENNIDFSYNLPANVINGANEFGLHLPIRSQAIVLFANLEVLFVLSIAYQDKTDDDKKIRYEAMNNKKRLKKFLNKYFFVPENKWYMKSQSRVSKINASKIRQLRNSLTHFFSVSAGIQLVPEILNTQAREMEKHLKGHSIVFLSPEDLYEMIQGAAILMMKEWGSDFTSNPKEFKEKILSVQSVVKKHAPIIVAGNKIPNFSHKKKHE